LRYAIISDIHSNLVALQNALDSIKTANIDAVICLGDVVGYGPRPNECAELVKENCKVCLMGNHDHAVLGLTDINYFNQYARESVLWTQKTITPENKAFLKGLPFKQEMNDTLFVHSTPIKPEEWDYIFSEGDARRNLDSISQNLVFIGHSHIPVVFPYNQPSFFEEKFQLDLANERYIINVGSIGQPRNEDPRSCFVIYDDQEQSINYVRLEYDVKRTFQDIIEKKLSPFLAIRLLHGF
jgi:diadenosine tetraphosphatase ApaH/serine/threonine PP2A family protein phosphatase